MFSFIFHNLFYRPLYNALVVLTAVVPNHDLGLAVVLLTLIVKTILIPISHKTIKTQKKLKELEPIMAKIKEDHKDQQEQALKIMELYKEHGVNPFSGIFLMFVQLPIILALYFVFRQGINLLSPDIYSFVIRPAMISPKLLGLIDLTQKSLILSLLVGITQFAQVQLSLPPPPPKSSKGEESFGDSLAQSMNFQVKFILPLFIMFISYNLNTAVSVYWIVNNLFMVVHELYVRRQAERIVISV